MQSRLIPPIACRRAIVATLAWSACFASCLLPSSDSRGVLGQETTAPLGKLTWNNEDSSDGRLLRIVDDHVFWQSPLFQQPMEVHKDFIDSIGLAQHVTQSGEPNPEPFRFETVSGDVLYGDLVAIHDDIVSLQSKRFGSVVLRRDSVREVRQLQHAKVVYDGPRWLRGWKVLKAGRDINEWKATEHGYLATQKYGGELFHELPFLDNAEINLVLRWNKRPGFQVDFSSSTDLLSSRPKPRLSIKSWGSDVVAQSSLDASDFQHLLKLTDRQQTLRLRLVWDNLAGEVVVHGLGRQLGRIVVDKRESNSGFGVLIKNRADDLVLEQIRVSKWNGISKSEDRDPGGGYLRLANGELVTEPIKSLNAATNELIVGKERRVKLVDVAVMEFVPTADATTQPAHLRFAEGTEISGNVVQLTDEAISIRSPISDDILRADVDRLTGIHFVEGRTSEYEFHLHSDGAPRLSGDLAAVVDSQQLGWKAVGSRNSVSLRPQTQYTIQRRMAVTSLDRVASEIVYLADGSLLIGEVDAIDAEKLTTNTSYSATTDIPISSVRAVEMLKGSGRVSFASKQWDFSRGEKPLHRSHEQLEVCEPVNFRDLEIYHGGKVSFSCTWDEDFVGLLTLNMGRSSQQPRGSVARFTFSRDRMSARCLLASITSRTLPAIPDRRATISIESKEKRVRIWVNGILVVDAAIRSDVEHRGLWIQCGSVSGPLSNKKRGQKPQSKLVLDRLRVGDNANRIGVAFAAADQLEMMLSLPRNRKDSVPKSVLCSTNGDLLRGNLLQMNRQVVSFQSKQKQLAMPRDEVAGVVWLRMPDESLVSGKSLASAETNELADTEESAAKESGPEEAASPSRDSMSSLIALSDGSIYQLNEVGMKPGKLTGLHPILQDCEFPVAKVTKLQIGNDSISKAATAIVDWKLIATPEPKFAEDNLEQGIESALVGKSVDDVVIPMLDGSETRLEDYRDKVVVLDFWASWCAPCIRSMPKLIATVDSFPPGTVELIAVNEEETPFDIKTALTSRDVDVRVGLDTEAQLASRFEVKAIPQTVIIGPDGKINRVFVGAPLDLHKAIAGVIAELLPPTD